MRDLREISLFMAQAKMHSNAWNKQNPPENLKFMFVQNVIVADKALII